jgi:ATP-binding cassette, subfamily B, multidrug efflux pump
MLNLHHPFLFYIKKFKGSFAMGTVALLFTNGFDILGPFLIGKLIDAMSGATLRSLSLNLFLLLCVSIGTAVFRYLWRIYFGYFHHSVAADLRKLLFKKMLSLGQNFHQKTPTGEKMTLITQDIENFRMGIGPGLLIFFDAVIYVLALIPLMLFIDVSWTVQCLVLMPLVPFVVYRLENKLTKSYRQLQDESGELTSFTQETVSGIKVIKSLGLNSLRSHLFERTNQRLKDYGIKMDRIESAFGPTLEFFVMIGTATLLFVGAEKVVSQQVSIGNFFAFYQYLLRMIWPMTAFGFSFMMYKEADSSFDRIKGVLEKKPWLENGDAEPNPNKTLEVKNLNFKYPETSDYILQDISFSLKANESMAIVGSVGSGKSTLVQILASLLPATTGNVFYDAQELNSFKKDSLRHIIALVPQKLFLFKKSIRENVLDFANPLNIIPLNDVLDDAHIKYEISNMTLQEETQLEENGQGLSGGQRQRLALARGLALKPQWLILDDTLSAVDIETEQSILRRLLYKKKEQHMNFIICSHRIQNLRWVDKILVLNHGRMVDIGDHETLFQRCEIYRQLYSSQKAKLDQNQSEIVSSTKEML